jgi:hypothetical protein
MVNELTKKFLEAVQKEYPNIMATVYPRRIIPPAGFLNPKYYGSSLSGLATLWDGKAEELCLRPHIQCALVALEQAIMGVPTYFIRDEFAQAVANTKLPMDFRLSELKWPLDAMLFVLSDSFVYDYFRFYTPFISICRCTAGIHPTREELSWALRHGWEVKRWMPITNQVEFMLTHFPLYLPEDVPQDFPGSWPLDIDLSTMQNADFCDATAYERSLRPELDLRPVGKTPTPDEETELRKKISMFAVKLLLAFAVRPHLVKPGSLQRKAIMKKGSLRDELWNPNLVGWEYTARHSEVSLGGTHASPRWHWRVGHFTNQFIGKRGEPDFVSAESLPRKASDGTIDWDQVSPEVQTAFRRNHELKWLEPVLCGGKDEKE